MKSDEGWMKNDERWRMNDAVWWFQAVEGFWFMTDGQTNKRTDICDCRVAFATENNKQNFRANMYTIFIEGTSLFSVVFMVMSGGFYKIVKYWLVENVCILTVLIGVARSYQQKFYTWSISSTYSSIVVFVAQTVKNICIILW